MATATTARSSANVHLALVHLHRQVKRPDTISEQLGQWESLVLASGLLPLDSQVCSERRDAAIGTPTQHLPTVTGRQGLGADRQGSYRFGLSSKGGLRRPFGDTRRGSLSSLTTLKPNKEDRQPDKSNHQTHPHQQRGALFCLLFVTHDSSASSGSPGTKSAWRASPSFASTSFFW